MTMLKIFFFSVFLIGCWLPYYTFGLGKFRTYLNDNNFLLGLMIVLLTLIPGYIGLWVVNKYLHLDPVYFRIIVIATAQLSSALVIAVVSDFNKFVIMGLILILIGSILTISR
jgi:hypothetical protein